MQVGVAWCGDFLTSLSLCGDLNYLDPATGTKRRALQGHQVKITTMTPTPDANGAVYTGSYDGVVCAWTEGAAVGRRLTGAVHTNQVQALGTLASGRAILSVGLDDRARTAECVSGSFSTGAASLEAQPRDVSCCAGDPTLAAIATNKGVSVLRCDSAGGGCTVALSIETAFEPTAIAVSPDGRQIVVGASDHKLCVWSQELSWAQFQCLSRYTLRHPTGQFASSQCGSLRLCTFCPPSLPSIAV